MGCCSGSLSNFNFMIFDLYTMVINFDVNFVHNLIGSRLFFAIFLLIITSIALISISLDESDFLNDESNKSFFVRFRCFPFYCFV